MRLIVAAGGNRVVIVTAGGYNKIGG